MKARFVLAVLALCASAFTSCTKVETNEIQTVLLNVKKTDWKYSNTDNNNYFYATFDMPEISAQVFDNGLIKTYRVDNFSSSNPVQIEMPYSRMHEYYVGKDQDGNAVWGFYTELVDYEIRIGQITICYTASDFDYEIDESFVPDAMQFRCVLMR